MIKNQKRRLTLLCALSAVMIFSACSKSTIGRTTEASKKDSSSYTLIWADEFDKAGSFDNKKWSYAPRGKVAWNKYMTHSADYVYQTDDKLILRMDNQKIAGDDVPYHAGGIQSLGKFSIRYGKVIVRAKFTQGRGSWPAIWMMPDPDHSLGGWPAGGEIDIMEHVNNEKVVHQTIHNSAVTDSNGGSTATHKSTYDIKEFNTYSIIWNPQHIEFYVNDKLEYTYEKKADATAKEWPFDVPFYLILNQAGGAGWPGPITNIDLPFSMEVDYVRVYNLPLQELAQIEKFIPIQKNTTKKAKKDLVNRKPGTIANADFESNDLYPWTSWGNSSVSNAQVHTGNFGIQSLGGETAIEQLITGLKPNTSYRFGGFTKVGTAGEKAIIGVKEYGGAPVNTSITATDFTDVSVIFTTGVSQTSAVVYFYKENLGSAFADDFYFIKQ